MLPFVGNICGYPPAVRPIADIRRSNFALLAEQAGGRPAIAAKLGKDPNQVDQWLMDPARKAARNIGGRSARMIEQAFGKAPGWLDHERDESVKVEAPSHLARIDLATLVAAINFMERQAALHGTRFDPARDADLLAMAYETEWDERTGATPDNLLDFGDALRKRLAGRISSGDKTGTRGADS